LDRKRLPAPEGEAYAAAGYEEPVGEIEIVLAEIWRKALQLDRVGRHDNFFQLGGHSLRVVRVVTLLEQVDINIRVMDLFTYPTIESLARKIELVGKWTSADTAICLREGGAETPLFLMHPSIYDYFGRSLAPYLDPSIPVYSLPPRPLSEPPFRTIEGIAMRMAQMIRSVQPEGPYRIAGYSNGGPLAYEIAAQLIGADQKVDFLGLFDSHYRGGISRDTPGIQEAFDWLEMSEKQMVLRVIEDSRRASQAAVDELKLSAEAIDFATFLRKCHDMSVLP
jgi:Thioesterase domain/Phosphopantetheine attachment site